MSAYCGARLQRLCLRCGYARSKGDSCLCGCSLSVPLDEVLRHDGTCLVEGFLIDVPRTLEQHSRG